MTQKTRTRSRQQYRRASAEAKKGTTSDDIPPHHTEQTLSEKSIAGPR